MITYLAKEGFAEATYARAARQRAFAGFLDSEIEGSISFFTEIGGSSASLSGSVGAIGRLMQGLRVAWTVGNPWIVVDYPNFPASVPRRLSVYLVATAYLAGLRTVCALRGARLVVQSDDDPAMQDQWLGTSLTRRQLFWERRLERHLYRSAHRIWFSGEAAAELLCEMFDVPISRAEHVPNGAVAHRRPLGRPDDGTFRFAYTGALLPDTHGVMGLLDAFGRVGTPRARLTIAGPEGEWVPEYLRQHPDPRVEYLGCLSAEDVQELLATCDAGVLAGQRGGYHETGFPGKLGAYFAAGLPVVSTCAGEAGRAIESGGVGVVCLESELPGVMESMVSDTDAYAGMRARAIEAHEEYFWNRIYRRAVEGLGSSPVGSTSGTVPDAMHCESVASGWQGSEL